MIWCVAREASRQNRRRACARATYCAVGLTVAGYCDLRPRMPTGSASPTRWRDMA
jgi:hypothetical protein